MEFGPEQVFGVGGMKLDAVSFDNTRQRRVVELRNVTPHPPCPAFGQCASPCHSVYRCTLADVPCAGHQTPQRLVVRRQFCQNPNCSQHIFSERFPTLALPFARTTNRFVDVLRSLGLHAGGRGGVRLASVLAMPVNRTKLLRIIRQTLLPAATSARVLGIDDWAYRKGLTYGTILVDLEAHQIVDLLLDRRAASVADWLGRHPGLQIITRDRASVYADGARQGASEAVQIADCWHLLKNLKDAVQATLLPWQDELRHQAGGAVAPPTDLQAEPPPTSPEPPALLAAPLLIPAHRQLQLDRIQTLRRSGSTIRSIAADVGRSRNTVKKYLALEVCPAPQCRMRASRLDPFKPLLLKRFQTGCHNARLLWEDVRTLGYDGGATTVKTFLASFRGQEASQAHTRSMPPRQPSIRTLSYLLTKVPQRRDAEEQRWVKQLTALQSEAATLVLLTQQFATMVRQKEVQALGTWLYALSYSWKRARYAPGKPLDPEVDSCHQALLDMLKKGH